MRRTLILFFLLMTTTLAFSQVNIWKGTPVHHRVEMTIYRANGANLPEYHRADGKHPCVVVLPGGSYFWHDIEAEGHEVAKWLNKNGITAVVLRYRTGYVPALITHYRLIFRGNRYPDALNDLRQTLRLIRRNADSYGVDTTMIGIMGFSAGGHLAMCSAELLPRTEWPAFIVPIYPVVTMIHPCVHKRSRRGLLGDSREHNRALQDSLSMERHVPHDCPPVFVVNCQDDPIVPRHNAELLDSALTANGVAHKFIQYRTGGHGFGASDTKGTEECRQWKTEFINWFRELKK